MRSVNLGRWSRRVERYFNMKGGGGLMDVEQAIRVILPIFVGVEDRYQEGWGRYGVFANQPAVAGQFSAIQWRNPAGSNVVGVFELIRDAEGVVDNPVLILKSNASDFATGLANQTRLDPRQNTQLPTLVGTRGSAVAQTGSVIMFQQTQASGPAVDFITNVDQQVVVAPGDALSVWGSIVNTAINVAAFWRERPLEASELT